MQSSTAVAKGYLDNVGVGMKQKGVAVKSAVRFGAAAEENAAEEIIKFASEISADIVSISTNVQSYDGHWLFDSVAERLLNKGNTFLLVTKALRAGAEH